MLAVAQRDGQLAVAEAESVALNDVVREMVEQSVGVSETVGECVTLLVRVAWLAVKEVLAVAQSEGQLAVADADSMPLNVGV